MKIAIIGTGFFGTTLALILSKRHNVDLYEKKKDILNGASFANQFRFHYGYHYPRSQKTVNEISLSKNHFTKFYGSKIFGNTKNYYMIAANSKTSLPKYIKFLKKNKLYFKLTNDNFSSNFIKKTILTNEKNLNYFLIKKKIINKIKSSNINLKLKSYFKKSYLKKYDKILVCCYSDNNKILRNLGIKKIKKYKFELIEKILIKLPKKYINKSIVVIDGSFVCVDPYLGTKFHLLSDVKESKLEIAENKFSIFKSSKSRFINRGIIKNIKISRFKKFIIRSSKYLPFLKYAKYYGSMFTVRCLEINKENTDERITGIIKHSSKILSIHSGKWNTCIYLAKKINREL